MIAATVRKRDHTRVPDGARGSGTDGRSTTSWVALTAVVAAVTATSNLPGEPRSSPSHRPAPWLRLGRFEDREHPAEARLAPLRQHHYGEHRATCEIAQRRHQQRDRHSLGHAHAVDIKWH